MRVNMGGLRSEAANDFEKHAKHIVERLLSMAGVNTPEYDWQVVMKDCAPYGKRNLRPIGDEIRLGQDYPGQRKIEFHVKGPDAAFLHSGMLCAKISDRWMENTARLRRKAIEITRATPATDEETVLISHPIQPVHLNGDGHHDDPPVENERMTKIRQMRDGMDLLLTMAADADADADLLAEAEQRYEQAKADADPLNARLRKVTGELKVAEDKLTEAINSRNSLKLRFEKAEQEMAAAEAAAASIRATRNQLSAAITPANEALEAATASLEEARRLTAERKKQLEDRPELIGLLAALEKLTSKPKVG